eukprot:CAMPEP_0202977490 /NCGR_PEP_ID=MMETSP1396-20130829/84278_1 /ASSEMBLY_ACC=CAM_ASM_000872 /TAXON_ID= /ORGANISM="Pseudokeronopsis sp., Strain Brazil" /LENGTH=287 /DNA_ID=CAMNT_0049716239 /DNA_START=131 /DNA_END=995 /DNA_ORIENTATION=+
MYIPKIPPKQAIGNKDMKFILDRRYYLERFLRKIAKYDYLLNSEEMVLFARPAGSIEQTLAKIPRLPTGTIIERIRGVTEINEKRYDMVDKERYHNTLIEFNFFYRKNPGVTEINEKRYDMVDKERYHNTLIEFNFFFKKVQGQMKMLKDFIEQSRVTKRISITHCKSFLNLVDKYEEVNMRTYVDNNDARLVLWKEQNRHIKEKIDNVVDNLKNPFDEMYNWCKGELYDLHALADAVGARDNIEKNLKKLEQRKKDLQVDLDNVQTGKKSVRTLLKNQSDTGNMVN